MAARTFSWQDVLEIRRRYEDGETQTSIALGYVVILQHGVEDGEIFTLTMTIQQEKCGDFCVRDATVRSGF